MFTLVQFVRVCVITQVELVMETRCAACRRSSSLFQSTGSFISPQLQYHCSQYDFIVAVTPLILTTSCENRLHTPRYELNNDKIHGATKSSLIRFCQFSETTQNSNTTFIYLFRVLVVYVPKRIFLQQGRSYTFFSLTT